MKLLYLLSVTVYLASVMAMPSKVSLTPISSEEDFGSLRTGGSLQNLAALHDRYPIYVLGPYHNEERQRPNLNALRGLNLIYDLPYTYPKRFLDKKSLDSIGGGHLI